MTWKYMTPKRWEETRSFLDITPPIHRDIKAPRTFFTCGKTLEILHKLGIPFTRSYHPHDLPPLILPLVRLESTEWWPPEKWPVV